MLAGPGTGKTTTMVEAIVDLVERRGVRPEQVLALTFSRKAAEQLRDRVTARLGRTLGHAAGLDVPLLRLLAGAPATPTRDAYAAPAAAALRAPSRTSAARAAAPTRPRRSLAGRAPAGGRAPAASPARCTACWRTRRERGLDRRGPRAARPRRARPPGVGGGRARSCEQYLDVLDDQSAIDYPDLVVRAVDRGRAPRRATELRAPLPLGVRRRVPGHRPQPGRASSGRWPATAATSSSSATPTSRSTASAGADVRGILDFPTAFPTADGVRAPVLALRPPAGSGPALLEASRSVATAIPLSGAVAGRGVRRVPPARPAGETRTAPASVDVLHLRHRARRDRAHRRPAPPRPPRGRHRLVGHGGARPQRAAASIPALRRSLRAAGVPGRGRHRRHARWSASPPCCRCSTRCGSSSTPASPTRPHPGLRRRRTGSRSCSSRRWAGSTPPSVRSLSRALQGRGRRPPDGERPAARPGPRRGARARLPRRRRRASPPAAPARLAGLLAAGPPAPRRRRHRRGGAVGALVRHRLGASGCASRDRRRRRRGPPRAPRPRRPVRALRAAARDRGEARPHQRRELPRDARSAGDPRRHARRPRGPRRGGPAAHRAPLQGPRVAARRRRARPGGHLAGPAPPRRRCSSRDAGRPATACCPRSTTATLLAEERRLFYVACTRARRAPAGHRRDVARRRRRAAVPLRPRAGHGQRARAPPGPPPAPAVARRARRRAPPHRCRPRASRRPLRRAAAHRLAAARADRACTARPVAPAADPATWWGLRAPSAGRGARPAGRRAGPALAPARWRACCAARPSGSSQREAGGEVREHLEPGLRHGGARARRPGRPRATSPRTSVDADLMAHVDKVWGQLEFRTPWSRGAGARGRRDRAAPLPRPGTDRPGRPHRARHRDPAARRGDAAGRAAGACSTATPTGSSSTPTAGSWSSTSRPASTPRPAPRSRSTPSSGSTSSPSTTGPSTRSPGTPVDRRAAPSSSSCRARQRRPAQGPGAGARRRPATTAPGSSSPSSCEAVAAVRDEDVRRPGRARTATAARSPRCARPRPPGGAVVTRRSSTPAGPAGA